MTKDGNGLEAYLFLLYDRFAPFSSLFFLFLLLLLLYYPRPSAYGFAGSFDLCLVRTLDARELLLEQSAVRAVGGERQSEDAESHPFVSAAPLVLRQYRPLEALPHRRPPNSPLYPFSLSLFFCNF
jgi:hypothetical protein